MNNNTRTVEAFAISCAGVLLFFFFRVGFADGDIGVTSLFLKATAEIIMTAVDGTGTAFAFYIIVAIFGFDFITADIAANSILIIIGYPPGKAPSSNALRRAGRGGRLFPRRLYIGGSRT